jgi:cellulose synthase/poly-beta-1,6-N-acetylglucosamine synthase-like glycosyltransferase
MNIESVLVGMFWFGCAWTLYAYLGFPAIAALLVAAKRPRLPSGQQDDMPVSVTVIIPAYNEEHHLDAKIRNVLAAKYPRSLLDVVVVSDASTDRTNVIARSFEADGVRVIVQERRRGKTAGLNRAVELARGDIVVFTDANATYPRDTIATLARYFDDPTVGLATGYTRYVATNLGEVAKATNVYTSLERVIKSGESRWGCCVGADGAIFAMRRSLYRPLGDDDINDFVLPLNVIEQGYRCVFAEDAFCWESPGKSLESEFRRQSRITNRTLRALWRHAHLLNPFRYGLFSLFLFSHKLVRFLAPVFLTLSAASLALLARTSTVSLIAVLGILVAIALAADSRSKVSFLNTFLTINLAVLQGWWRFICGRTDITWQPDRSGSE